MSKSFAKRKVLRSLTKSYEVIGRLILLNNKHYTLQLLNYDLSFPRSIPGRSKKFSTLQSVHTGSVGTAEPPIQWVLVTPYPSV